MPQKKACIGVNALFNHAMNWIWQQSDWPNFRYARQEFEGRDNEFRINSGRLMGRFESLLKAYQEDATIDLMLSEAIHTSAIEGEVLNRESVRSSLLSLITSDTLPRTADQKAAGGRQAKVVARMFAEGREGFEGGISTKKYEAIAKCPNRTASRDLSDLVEKGIITPLPGGGRTTRYKLATSKRVRLDQS